MHFDLNCKSIQTRGLLSVSPYANLANRCLVLSPPHVFMSIAIPSPNLTSESSERTSLDADSLMAGLSFMMMANVLQRGIGFVRNLALCRFLADEHLGLWALASSFFMLAAPFSVLGLPGTFGRLVEPYRLSGQLHFFLRRVAYVSSIGISLCIGWLVGMPSASSTLVFGTELSVFTMLLVALALLSVILFNSMTELLSGLRKPRVVSTMHTCNSLVFTAASLGGLWLVTDWRMLVAAFAVGCAAGIVPAIPILRELLMNAADTNQSRRVQSDKPDRLGGEMWRRVIPFAASIWCMNLLINLFDVVDRYMLLYLTEGSKDVGIAMVGQFHSGRIMPVLLSSLTLMLSGLLLPYLAADWEAGKRKKVHESLRLTFKFASLFFFGLSIASLAIAPILFEFVLNGRYSDGLAIMPQAMLHCCLAGLAFLMQNYFWCAERGRYVGLIIGLGLLINILLNLLWVPMWGLRGAMLATSVSGGAILLMTIVAMRWSGVRLGIGAIVLGLLPLSLILGTGVSAIAMAATMILVSRTSWIFSDSEKSIVDSTLLPKLNRFGFSAPSLFSTVPFRR
jgi:polysaccharide transporter, PST family